jgi:hypothetical protein
MRQKPAPRRRAESSESSSLPESVSELLAKRDREAAAALQQLTLGEDRALAKAARRALFLLKQEGIEPPPLEKSREGLLSTTRPVVSINAFMTSLSGRGEYSLLFIREDLSIGSPVIISYHLSDRLGVLDVFGKKVPRDGLEDILERWRSEERGWLFAEVPLDYARFLVAESVPLNRTSRKMLPEGFYQNTELVGAPEREYTESPLYSLLDAESVKGDFSISHDPDRLLEERPMSSWFVEVTDILPWKTKYVEAQQTRLVLSQSQQAQMGARVLDEAVDALFPPEALLRLRRRLEMSALVFYHAGNEELARQALYHALSLSTERAAHNQPFPAAMARRTIERLIAIDQQEAASRKRVSPDIIERI